VTRDLDLTNAVDGDLVDDRCADTGMPYCPGDGVPSRWMPDPFDADISDDHRLVYLHDDCAEQRAANV
jgi:hypothetical protein